MTSIPGSAGGYVSDGGRFLMLRRGGMQAERWLALASIVPTVRPRKWQLGAASAECVDGSVDGVIVASALYCVALYAGRPEEAGLWLDRMIAFLERTPPYMCPGVLVKAAWFTAARRGQAVLLAEGRAAEAEEKRQEALALLDRAAPSGATAFERDLFGVT